MDVTEKLYSQNLKVMIEMNLHRLRFKYFSENKIRKKIEKNKKTTTLTLRLNRGDDIHRT